MANNINQNPLLRIIGEDSSLAKQNRPQQVANTARPKADGTLKFPSNEKIADQVENALESQARGTTLDRGSIVNILV